MTLSEYHSKVSEIAAKHIVGHEYECPYALCGILDKNLFYYCSIRLIKSGKTIDSGHHKNPTAALNALGNNIDHYLLKYNERGEYIEIEDSTPVCSHLNAYIDGDNRYKCADCGKGIN